MDGTRTTPMVLAMVLIVVRMPVLKVVMVLATTRNNVEEREKCEMVVDVDVAVDEYGSLDDEWLIVEWGIIEYA